MITAGTYILIFGAIGTNISVLFILFNVLNAFADSVINTLSGSPRAFTAAFTAAFSKLLYGVIGALSFSIISTIGLVLITLG